MPYCENCGKPVYEFDLNCANCGAPVRKEGVAFEQPPERPRAGAESNPVTPANFEGLSTWGFVGSLLLLCIPLVGFILSIVWAAGGTENLTRRNLARGILIVIGLWFAFCILLSILLASTAIAYSGALSDLL